MKKLPTWVKILIVLAALVVGLSLVTSVGLTLLAGFLSGGDGKELVEKGMEGFLEKGLEGDGEDIDADVDLGEGRLILKDKRGGQQFAVQTAPQLPRGFPGDLPVYSGAEVKGSAVMGSLTMVNFEVSAPTSQVSEFYAKEFPRRGWTSPYGVAPASGSFSGMYLKGGRQATVAVTAAGGPGRSAVVLSYGLAEPPAGEPPEEARAVEREPPPPEEPVYEEPPPEEPEGDDPYYEDEEPAAP